MRGNKKIENINNVSNILIEYLIHFDYKEKKHMDKMSLPEENLPSAACEIPKDVSVGEKTKESPPRKSPKRKAEEGFGNFEKKVKISVC